MTSKNVSVFLFLFLIGCTAKDQESDFNTAKHSNVGAQIVADFDSTFTEDKKIDSIVYVHSFLAYKGPYKVVVTEKRIDDSVHFVSANIFNQIPIANSISFYKDNKLLSSTKIPFNIALGKNYKQQDIRYLDNKISQIALHTLHGELLFSLTGYGGCNSCNESSASYSFTGDLIYFWYGNKLSVVKEIKNPPLSEPSEIKFVREITF